VNGCVGYLMIGVNEWVGCWRSFGGECMCGLSVCHIIHMCESCHICV